MLNRSNTLVLASSLWLLSCGNSQEKNEFSAPPLPAEAKSSVLPSAPNESSVQEIDRSSMQATLKALPNACRSLRIADTCSSNVGTATNPIEINGDCLSAAAVSLCAQKDLYFKVNIHSDSYLSLSVFNKVDPLQEDLATVSPNLTITEVLSSGIATAPRKDSTVLNYEQISWRNSGGATLSKLIKVSEASGRAVRMNLLSVEKKWGSGATLSSLGQSNYEIDQFPSPNSDAEGYRIKIPEFSYLRRELIETVMKAAKDTHAKFPEHGPVTLLNMSYLDGSVSYSPYVRCARMGHTMGYDADISYFQKDKKNDGQTVCDIDPMTDQCIPGTVDRLDRQATAYFIVQVSASPKVRFTLSDNEIISEILKGGDELLASGRISQADHKLLQSKAKLKDLVAIHYGHMHVQSVRNEGSDELSTWSAETNYLRENVIKLQKPDEVREDDCNKILQEGM
jgi:hypothetical protein